MTREQILSEIRRVAADIGHSPGKREFYTAAGIKETDWRGRFWARWSDALLEAGFEPNRLQEAFPDEHLLECLANLTRKLGRFPTSAELRLARTQEPSFPNDKTFRRYGNRDGLLMALTGFCEDRDDFEDVRAIAADTTSFGHTVADTPEHRHQDVLGHVYLLKSARFYKIGRSNAAGRRERELAIQLPDKAKNVHVISTDDPVGIERYWHGRFADRRKNGEWFELSAEDVRAFKRRRFM